jgi:hypothetical protein
MSSTTASRSEAYDPTGKGKGKARLSPEEMEGRTQRRSVGYSESWMGERLWAESRARAGASRESWDYGNLDLTLRHVHMLTKVVLSSGVAGGIAGCVVRLSAISSFALTYIQGQDSYSTS